MSHPGSQWQQSLPTELQEQEEATSWVLCRIGSERFALPLGAVSELLEEPQLASMPALGGGVLGMLVTRSGRLPVHDPARLLGHAVELPVRAVLVIGEDDKATAVAVDEVAETIELEDNMIRTLPALDDPFKVVSGVAVDHEGLVTVLDTSRLLRALESTEDAR